MRIIENIFQEISRKFRCFNRIGYWISEKRVSKIVVIMIIILDV